MNQQFTKIEKIRFRHTDFAGIVFYPRFLEMLNDLVEDWFETALERPFNTMHQTGGIPTVDLKIQFKTAARLGEIIYKNLWVIELKTSSVVCGFLFENQNKEIVLQGQVTLVNVVFDNNKTKIKAAPFDQNLQNRIALFTIDKY